VAESRHSRQIQILSESDHALVEIAYRRGVAINRLVREFIDLGIERDRREQARRAGLAPPLARSPHPVAERV
jgi:hypothetical protein